MVINVLEYLEASGQKHPDKKAFADTDKDISYRELEKQARRIGTYLAGLGEGSWRNRPVAVLIDRNIESLILFMGVVYSGNFYVPVDASMPLGRVELIFDTLKPVVILNARRDMLVEEGQWGIPVVSYEQAVSETDMSCEEEQRLLDGIRRRVVDTDPLYAIFTSGSTGVPKGVLVNHRSVIDLVEQFAETFPFPDEPVFGNQAPMDFDVSVKDIYTALKLGGTVEVIPKQFFSFPVKLIPHLNERGINVIIWAVSALRIVANFKTFDKVRPENLQLVMFSGEVMPVRDLNYWRKAVPDAVYVNLYGPTEITCNCSYYIVDREFENDQLLPIGQSFRNCELLLLGEDDRLITGDGITGEICVRGTCLAMGYYNNKERTQEAFVQNPLQSAYPEYIYRTGDLGRYEGGELYYAARRDYQIKHMGHRIELGEIEAAVYALDFIDAACCIFDEKKEKILLCYQARESCDKEIIKYLSERLPKFMWPNRYIFYEKLPLNKNGKLDRVYLKQENCQ